MEGCSKFMKYSLFVSNFIILIGGIAVVAVGSVTLHNQKIFEEIVGDELYMSSSIVLIGTGILIVLFSFLGCWGAIKEVKCLLLMYIIIVLIVFVVLMIGGILAYVFRGKISDPIKDQMKNSMTKYETNDAIKATWDNTQTLFHCCGVENANDWKDARSHIPQSCCENKDNCPSSPNTSDVWKTGCLTKFKEGAATVGCIGIVVACLLILGLLFSCGVFKSIK